MMDITITVRCPDLVRAAELLSRTTLLAAVPEEPASTNKDLSGDWTPGGGDPDQELISCAEGPEEKRQEAPQETAADKPKPRTKKTRQPAQTAAEAVSVTEDFRLEVRRQLAVLNRKAGYNRAAELIEEITGANAKLTEVDLDDLPKIMAAAKEETNAD